MDAILGESCDFTHVVVTVKEEVTRDGIKAGCISVYSCESESFHFDATKDTENTNQAEEIMDYEFGDNVTKDVTSCPGNGLRLPSVDLCPPRFVAKGSVAPIRHPCLSRTYSCRSC